MKRAPHALARFAGLRWGRFALVFAVSFGYATEVLFQPDVFSRYAFGAIASAVGSILLEGLLVGAAVIGAVAIVDRRPARLASVYAGELIAAVFAGAITGVAAWAALAGPGVSMETTPFLFGETLRLAALGSFLVLVYAIGERIRAGRDREREITLESEALRAETELAQLRLLEAQIEPHFLFNTIANVRRTWRIDSALGARMHDNAIRYLEASLPRMRAAACTLGDEVELTRAYLELFALRMGPRLAFSIDVPAAFEPMPFPRMALLTLIENSIKHGLMPSEHGGSIAIAAEAEAGSVVVSVTDDGVGFGVADTGGTGIGLVNIRARLVAQYGRRARLELGSGPGGGVVARLRLPRGDDTAGNTSLPTPPAALAAVAPR